MRINSCGSYQSRCRARTISCVYLTYLSIDMNCILLRACVREFISDIPMDIPATINVPRSVVVVKIEKEKKD